MVYLTQLVYVRPGEEETFLQFEEIVLALLAKYEGELLLRLRPTADTLVDGSIELPYELHLVRFASEERLDQYGRDPARQRVLELKDRSLRASLVVQGAVTSGKMPGKA